MIFPGALREQTGLTASPENGLSEKFLKHSGAFERPSSPVSFFLFLMFSGANVRIGFRMFGISPAFLWRIPCYDQGFKAERGRFPFPTTMPGMVEFSGLRFAPTGAKKSPRVKSACSFSLSFKEEEEKEC